MRSSGGRVVAQLGAALVLVVCWLSPVSAEEFSEAERERAASLVGQLDSEVFAEREAAVKELGKLSSAAVPWLEAQIAASGGIENIDRRSRLKAVVRSLKERRAVKDLRDGSRIKLNLEDASPEEVVRALDSAAGVRLTGVGGVEIWGDMAADRKGFSYSGNYWGAVDALIKAFPPGGGGREDLGNTYRIVRWDKADFAAAANPSATAGILRIRHARFALENFDGRDHLVLNLVPSVEPIYQVEELAVSVKRIEGAAGVQTEPAQSVCEWEATHDGKYKPGSVFAWEFGAGAQLPPGGKVRVEGAAKLTVRRTKWFEIDLPEDIGVPIKLTADVQFTLLEREGKRLKIQFEGSGTQPAMFNDYELRKEGYSILDAAGEELKFSVNSSSSGGGNAWRNAYGGTVEGEPARVRVRLPLSPQQVELDFELEDVQLPGVVFAAGDGGEAGRPEAVRGARGIGEVIIEIGAGGSLSVEGREIEPEELEKILGTIVELSADQGIILRAGLDVGFEHVVAALELCQRAGASNIAFATRKAGADEDSPGGGGDRPR